MKMTAQDQEALGVVDEVIAEPPGGAHTDVAETGRRLAEVVVRELDRLVAVPLDTLVEQRYRRYRSLGAYGEVAAPAPTPTVPPRAGFADRLRGILEAGSRAIPAPLPVGRRQEPPAREDV
jgi:F420-0:gamma-glutamyl ligase-like protein